MLAVREWITYPSGDVIAFYDTDGNELSGLDDYRTGFVDAPWGAHLTYYNYQ